ncbi:hypothetical protein C7974DRAFT_399137 [Boeremia exigua]|uniref:uncharacterized protein n=1 Tax=Boeremia exigua TaxID=749465 RepID=UPI001E8E0F68|nr:uncharacterized protein C7974DRAFT_399137 [Boeremia exigua]KAH6620218.1 hypothetical protein C7974DRAFT_399137 [Boeremia exigua]
MVCEGVHCGWLCALCMLVGLLDGDLYSGERENGRGRVVFILYAKAASKHDFLSSPTRMPPLSHLPSRAFTHAGRRTCTAAGLRRVAGALRAGCDWPVWRGRSGAHEHPGRTREHAGCLTKSSCLDVGHDDAWAAMVSVR